MTNNYILRRLRYTFNYSDQNLVDICASVKFAVTKDLVKTWLKKDDDPDYVRCSDHEMAQFLNGLIITRRGTQDGKIPRAEYQLNNNIILRKLKIALNYRDDDILSMLSLARFPVGRAELSALFRKPEHRHYRQCQDQLLRNFLQGLQLHCGKQSTAEPQSKYQALKATAENRRENDSSNDKKSKPFSKKKSSVKKVVYQNPKKTARSDRNNESQKRKTISLSKSQSGDEKVEERRLSGSATNESIWGKKTAVNG
ncbi:DUF1456 family protein [Bermanella marisrubri]|uniref:DUF1456 family protein n=1 Tax=Bermanella marisrubri TaxID=207949 RepID=Q1N2Q6_9GAMM|nr:hypothetical protein RED65_06948 [Oceanobacter sp. RED65] [Bermanella marisrubri]QIZ84835.1 DUF1456 family protein [Bermanella marisrubri]